MGIAYCYSAILDLILVVVVGCTKVHVATGHKVLMTEVVGLFIVGLYHGGFADNRAKTHLTHELTQPDNMLDSIV